MRRINSRKVIKNNRIVLIVRDLESGQTIRQGKRVPKDFPLTKEERKGYIEHGIVRLVKMYKERKQLGLAEAYREVKQALGEY